MYPGTEKLKARGINSKAIARYTRYLIDNLDEKELFEILPQPITDKYKLINRFEAYKQIHYPDSEAHFATCHPQVEI